MPEQPQDTILEEKPTEGRTVSRSKRRKIGAAVACILPLITICGIWSLNYFTVIRPLQRVITDNSANNVVKASAHLGNWTDPKTLVFNLTDITGDASRLDVFRVFLQYAEAMKDKQYDKVVLAARGKAKFQIDGSYFRQLGEEYGTQNPMYTIRTFPTHLDPLDGGSRFAEYDGGILAVLTAEMNQFSQFSDRWYMKDFASSLSSLPAQAQNLQPTAHTPEKATASSDTVPTVQSPSSAWNTNTQVNPVSGETTIYANAGYGNHTLIVRLRGKKMELFVNTGEFLETVDNMHSGLVPITYRVDDAKPVHQYWHLSSDNTALFYPGNPAPLVEKLRTAKEFHLEYPPADKVPQVLSIDVSGFPNDEFKIGSPASGEVPRK